MKTMRKLYVFKIGEMYFTKDEKLSPRMEDALVVDDWAVEYYLQSKLKKYDFVVKLIEVEENDCKVNSCL